MNYQNTKAGYFENNGYVYDREQHHVGTVHLDDGRIYDMKNNPVGKVVGGHFEKGGAAYLLLVE